MYCISPWNPFFNHFSNRGASSSRNSAFEIPAEANPRRIALSLMSFVYLPADFRSLKFFQEPLYIHAMITNITTG
jgi:hypothetical protein